MIEQDTIRLLRECDAGVKMGIASIDDVLAYVSNPDFKQNLTSARNNHIDLKDKIQHLLEQYHDDGKEPPAMAKGMSWLKTNVKLVLDESDQTIADLMTDGCNMGIKSLHKYLNEYKAADEASKGIARQLISLEENMIANIKKFL